VGVAGDKVLLVGGGRVDIRDRASGKRLALTEPFRGRPTWSACPAATW
jgi:hypothetical protein